MKLYANYAATTSRAVLAFCEAEGIDIDVESVDLMEGAHHLPSFVELNPNRMIPVLEDDGFVLTEASAILRYLASKTRSGLYPEDLRARARVDELMAWFEANLYKDLGFQFVYPQLFPHHDRGSQEANHATVQWGKAKACHWLSVLDQHYLAHGGKYLTGDQPTIADYLGGSIISLAELVHCSLSEFPAVDRWYRGLMNSPPWVRVNGAFIGFAKSTEDRAFVGLT